MIFQIENIAITDAGGLLWHLITWGIKNFGYCKIVKISHKPKGCDKNLFKCIYKDYIIRAERKKGAEEKSEPVEK